MIKIEIIFSDNGSTDNSMSILSSFTDIKILKTRDQQNILL